MCLPVIVLLDLPDVPFSVTITPIAQPTVIPITETVSTTLVTAATSTYFLFTFDLDHLPNIVWSLQSVFIVILEDFHYQSEVSFCSRQSSKFAFPLPTNRLKCSRYIYERSELDSFYVCLFSKCLNKLEN